MSATGSPPPWSGHLYRQRFTSDHQHGFRILIPRAHQYFDLRSSRPNLSVARTGGGTRRDIASLLCLGVLSSSSRTWRSGWRARRLPSSPTRPSTSICSLSRVRCWVSLTRSSSIGSCASCGSTGAAVGTNHLLDRDRPEDHPVDGLPQDAHARRAGDRQGAPSVGAVHRRGARGCGQEAGS